MVDENNDKIDDVNEEEDNVMIIKMIKVGVQLPEQQELLPSHRHKD